MQSLAAHLVYGAMTESVRRSVQTQLEPPLPSAA